MYGTKVKLTSKCLIIVIAFLTIGYTEVSVIADSPSGGSKPVLESITQEQIENGEVSPREIHDFGRYIFSKPFTKLDGYGDGPADPCDAITPGGRPTLQGNGTFLRVNGLDAQSCFECHSVLSSAAIPATCAVGGFGSSSSNVLFQPTVIDVNDNLGAGIASFNGRFINPPFVFGSGGVELLAKEMTTDLQLLKAFAQANPGTDVALVTKGVNFGVIRFEAGMFDTSGVEGIDTDLVVRPFGRKGGFATTREFSIGALQFHQGMQPVEVVGQDIDADGDGIANEITVGEVSALSIFNTMLEPPYQKGSGYIGREGAELFNSIGCAACHIPLLNTDSKFLTYSFPEVANEPSANIFYEVDLSKAPVKFERIQNDHYRIEMHSYLLL